MGNVNREKLLARQKALEAEKAAILARMQANQAKLSQQERKDDTRRKILVGSFYLARAEQDERANAVMLKDMSSHLTRPDDRKLFGLPPLPEKPMEMISRAPEVDLPDSLAPIPEEAARQAAH